MSVRTSAAPGFRRLEDTDVRPAPCQRCRDPTGNCGFSDSSVGAGNEDATEPHLAHPSTWHVLTGLRVGLESAASWAQRIVHSELRRSNITTCRTTDDRRTDHRPKP